MADQFYDDIPALANTIANDIDQIEKTLGFIKDKFQSLFPNWSNTDATSDVQPIQGSGVSGQLFNIVQFKIEDGTNASTIKVTITELFNGSGTAEVQDNIALNATTGNFTFSTGGVLLTYDWDGVLSRDAVAVGILNKIEPTDEDIMMWIRATSGNVDFTPYDRNDGSGVVVKDLSVAVDTATFYYYCLVIDQPE